MPAFTVRNNPLTPELLARLWTTAVPGVDLTEQLVTMVTGNLGNATSPSRKSKFVTINCPMTAPAQKMPPPLSRIMRPWLSVELPPTPMFVTEPPLIVSTRLVRMEVLPDIRRLAPGLTTTSSFRATTLEEPMWRVPALTMTGPTLVLTAEGCNTSRPGPALVKPVPPRIVVLVALTPLATVITGLPARIRVLLPTL